MTFYERYVKCCKEKGVLPASQSTAEAVGCTRSNITMLSKTGATPKGEVVAGAAQFLDVSADYLLGLIDTPRPILNDFSEEDARIMSFLRELNTEGKEAAEAMIRGLAGQNIYKTDNATVMGAKEA